MVSVQRRRYARDISRRTSLERRVSSEHLGKNLAAGGRERWFCVRGELEGKMEEKKNLHHVDRSAEEVDDGKDTGRDGEVSFTLGLCEKRRNSRKDSRHVQWLGRRSSLDHESVCPDASQSREGSSNVGDSIRDRDENAVAKGEKNASELARSGVVWRELDATN